MATTKSRKPAATRKPALRKPVAGPKTAVIAPQKKPLPKNATSTTVTAPRAVSQIVRDSFTMTAADQELLKNCKRDAIITGRDSTKKSEVVRAALRHFATLAAATRLMEINGLDAIKTGRPKKPKK